ncbi:hypothetical protein [Chamaesiphon polymorphus]|uniref:Uncharacterized protein n=1 Tax=Chamaesiphon polymorphus CCALA 037 TaxID=2107692 RepID=A0A2T1GC51_9CYAN|nr:hypothetical protein [Chamaesiphon polymorphus]PSB54927.1 hypothetical protein C7B77_16685 [Chamaesiphon polymorphus CCALA 037]
MTPARPQRPIAEIESDLLDCLLKCPQIDLQARPTTPDFTDYYRESDCPSILLDLRDENFQARSQAFLTHLQSCWTDIDRFTLNTHRFDRYR